MPPLPRGIVIAAMRNLADLKISLLDGFKDLGVEVDALGEWYDSYTLGAAGHEDYVLKGEGGIQYEFYGLAAIDESEPQKRTTQRKSRTKKKAPTKEELKAAEATLTTADDPEELTLFAPQYLIYMDALKTIKNGGDKAVADAKKTVGASTFGKFEAIFEQNPGAQVSRSSLVRGANGEIASKKFDANERIKKAWLEIGRENTEIDAGEFVNAAKLLLCSSSESFDASKSIKPGDIRSDRSKRVMGLTTFGMHNLVYGKSEEDVIMGKRAEERLTLFVQAFVAALAGNNQGEIFAICDENVGNAEFTDAFFPDETPGDFRQRVALAILEDDDIEDENSQYYQKFTFSAKDKWGINTKADQKGPSMLFRRVVRLHRLEKARGDDAEKFAELVAAYMKEKRTKVISAEDLESGSDAVSGSESESESGRGSDAVSGSESESGSGSGSSSESESESDSDEEERETMSFTVLDDLIGTPLTSEDDFTDLKTKLNAALKEAEAVGGGLPSGSHDALTDTVGLVDEMVQGAQTVMDSTTQEAVQAKKAFKKAKNAAKAADIALNRGILDLQQALDAIVKGDVDAQDEDGDDVNDYDEADADTQRRAEATYETKNGSTPAEVRAKLQKAKEEAKKRADTLKKQNAAGAQKKQKAEEAFNSIAAYYKDVAARTTKVTKTIAEEEEEYDEEEEGAALIDAEEFDDFRQKFGLVRTSIKKTSDDVEGLKEEVTKVGGKVAEVEGAIVELQKREQGAAESLTALIERVTEAQEDE